MALGIVGFVWVGLLGGWATFGNGVLLNSILFDVSDAELVTASGMGALTCILIWVIASAVMYWRAHRALPRLLGAHVPSEDEATRLNTILRRLLASAGVMESAVGTAEEAPVRVLLWDVPGGNAFAVGNLDRGAIVVTQGLMAALDDSELEAVVAHELAHLCNGDSTIMLQAATLVSMLILFGMYGAAVVIAACWLAFVALAAPFSALSDMSGDGLEGCIGVLMVLGLALYVFSLALGFALAALIALGIPFVLAAIAIGSVFSALSYSREYLADACSAQWTRNPGSLARALAKLTLSDSPLPKSSIALQPLHIVKDSAAAAGTSHFRRGISLLLRTHPKVEDRIDRLREMEGTSAESHESDSRSERATIARALSIFDWKLPLTVSASLAILSLWGAWSVSQGTPLFGSGATAPSEPRAVWGTLNADRVRLRTGPGTDHGVIGLMSKGLSLKIMGSSVADQSGLNWIRVRVRSSHGQVYEGWVAARFVRISGQAEPRSPSR